MAANPKPADPYEDLTQPEEIEISYETIELPQATTRDGGTIRVRVVQLTEEEIVPILQGYAVSGDLEPNSQASTEALLQFGDRARKLAEKGVVFPKFWFDDTGPEPGKAPWRALKLNDKIAIANAIVRVSGFSSEKTKPLRAFPERQGGDAAPAEGGGGGGDGAGEAGPDRAPLSEQSRVWPELEGAGGA